MIQGINSKMTALDVWNRPSRAQMTVEFFEDAIAELRLGSAQELDRSEHEVRSRLRSARLSVEHERCSRNDVRPNEREEKYLRGCVAIADRALRLIAKARADLPTPGEEAVVAFRAQVQPVVDECLQQAPHERTAGLAYARLQRILKEAIMATPDAEALLRDELAAFEKLIGDYSVMGMITPAMQLCGDLDRFREAKKAAMEARERRSVIPFGEGRRVKVRAPVDVLAVKEDPMQVAGNQDTPAGQPAGKADPDPMQA